MNLNQKYSSKLIINTNNPPGNPELNGPSLWLVNQIYQLNIKSTDPEGDPIQYYVDWGDLTHTGWFGPYPSGIECNATHTWHAAAHYTVKVKARDSNLTESNSSQLVVNITSQIITYKAFLVAFCIDRRTVGDFYYFRTETDSYMLKLPPDLTFKILPINTEIIVSKNRTFGLIINNHPEYYLIGFFPTFVISDSMQ